MSPYDLTHSPLSRPGSACRPAPGPNDATLAALVTAASRRSTRRLAGRACCRRPTPRRSISRRSRVTLRQWPVLQVNAVTVARRRRPARPDRGSERVDRLRPSAGRRGAARTAAGARPVRRLLSAGPAEPRRLLSRRLRRAGRGADGSRRRVRPSSRRLRPMGRGRSRSRRHLCRDRRAAQLPSRQRPGAGQYAVERRRLCLLRGRRRSAARISYGYMPQDVAQAATRTGGRAFPRRRAHRPQVEVASADRKRSLTTRARSRRRSWRCCNPTSGSTF